MFSFTFFSVITHITVISNNINDDEGAPGPPPSNQGILGSLTNNQGAPGTLTENQGVPGGARRNLFRGGQAMYLLSAGSNKTLQLQPGFC